MRATATGACTPLSNRGSPHGCGKHYAERGTRIAAGADALASLLLGMSLDVAHRALTVDGAGIDAACDLAITATMAVLRDVRPEQLQALDASLGQR